MIKLLCYLICILLLVGCVHQRYAMEPVEVSPPIVAYSGRAVSVQELGVSLASLPNTCPVHDSTQYYEYAYLVLDSMLKGTAPLSFKRAVFTTENAWFDNQMSYSRFGTVIKQYAEVCRRIEDFGRLKNYHHYEDSLNIVKNEAVFTFMMRPVCYSPLMPLILRPAYTYDFEDCLGERNWTKTFVVKLIATNSGTCHSMPYLYKILAEEIGTEASLAQAPNHLYIRQECKKYNGYNTELTSGQFPIDGWIMAAGYVSADAIRSGAYMRSLDNRESIALCLYDLAEGYRHKFRNDTAKFILRCLDQALTENPQYIDALQLKGRTLMKLYKINHNKVEQQALYTDMEKAYVNLATLGYHEMPEQMYRECSADITKGKEKYTALPVNKASSKLINYRKPVRIASLSNGRYQEFFTSDSLIAIDNVILSAKAHCIKRINDKALRPEGTSRWMSVDPLAQKYPGISPYVTTFNNPLAFMDPDGNSGRLSAQKGQDGVIELNLETTIFLYGKDADIAAKNADEAWGGTHTALVTQDGIKYKVNITMHFVHSDQLEQTMQSTAPLSDGLFHPKQFYDKGLGVKPGDNFLKTDLSGNHTGPEAGHTYVWGDVAEVFDIRPKPNVHEGLHMIGFGDRYDPVISTSVCQPDPGFQDDFMSCGADGYSFTPSHFFDVVSFYRQSYEDINPENCNPGTCSPYFKDAVINYGIGCGEDSYATPGVGGTNEPIQSVDQKNSATQVQK